MRAILCGDLGGDGQARPGTFKPGKICDGTLLRWSWFCRHDLRFVYGSLQQRRDQGLALVAGSQLLFPDPGRAVSEPGWSFLDDETVAAKVCRANDGNLVPRFVGG